MVFSNSSASSGGRPRVSGLPTAVRAAASISYRRKANPAWRAPSWLPASAFPKDLARLFLMQRSPDRSWKLATVDVRTLREISATLLNIPPDSTVAGFSLHPGGKRFAIAVGTAKRDIWLMQGFDSLAAKKLEDAVLGKPKVIQMPRRKAS